MSSKKFIKFKSILRQNSIAFSIVFIWFIINYSYFALTTSDYIEGLLILFYFKTHESLYGNFYERFSELIIFGLLFSL
ncbi:MAG: hypothetical protein ACFFDN_23380, partial [Candidatus Hodarchaeota archaeon]